ncbi:MAG: OB-fold nucleic acid binding domain-containing protein [Candidatus Aenigmatarchaeota archaeon]
MLRTCLLCSLLGVAGIIIFSPKEPVTYTIGGLKAADLGNNVALNGTIISLYTTNEGHSFLTLTDGTGSIRVVAFKGTSLNGAKEGSNITVTGTYTTYENEKEIIAEEIMPAA